MRWDLVLNKKESGISENDNSIILRDSILVVDNRNTVLCEVLLWKGLNSGLVKRWST